MGSTAPPAAAAATATQQSLLILHTPIPPRQAMASPRIPHAPRPRWRAAASAVVLFSLLASLLPAPAAAAADPQLVTADPFLAPVATLAADAGIETLIRDNRIPVLLDGQWAYVDQDQAGDLRRRAAESDTTTTTASESADITTTTSKTTTAKSTTSKTTVTTATSTASGTGTADASTSTATITSGTTTVTASSTKTSTTTSSALPSPFDTSISSNFTDSCPDFIDSFLTNETFKQCYPFSMLLQGSNSFFKAEKSLVTISQVLDATCAANVTFCASYLKTLAANLTTSANCGSDYALGNSIVIEAYLGMIAYQELYTTSCLKDPDTANYCFGNAVTNLSTPSNVYFYYLPLNISLPGSSVPSCNWCLKENMAVFQAATANRKLPIAYTYVDAAIQVNTICGPTFVNNTLAAAVSSGASSVTLRWQERMPPPWLAPLAIPLLAAYVLL